MSKELYPIGIQTFEEILKGGYVYVDKTRHVYNLTHEGKYYFLSRPRRFGKSLLVSTLETYFLGRRELFEGLSIAKLEQEWVAYPVLHLDLSTRNYQDENSLKEEFNKHLEVWEARWGDQYKDREPEERFFKIVELAYRQTGRQVVILVDEYDKPLISTLLNKPLQQCYRAQLKAFYGVLKRQDRYIRFAFLTGVTKFSKVSIFSDLNNLKDISLHPDYADVCGITEEEIHCYFEPALHRLAQAQEMTYDEALEELRSTYDGYHFGLRTMGVYNPFSLLNALQDSNYGYYWFETGTPTFLTDVLRRSQYRLDNLTRERISSTTLGNLDAQSGTPIPLLYQSGYLTIVGYLRPYGLYQLDFPNREVEWGFLNCLMPAYAPSREHTEFDVSLFVEDVLAGQADRFMHRLQTLFADSTYELAGDREIYFQNVLYVVFRLMGLFVEVEREMADGRMDMVVKTPDYIYIIECKLDKSAQEALQQIEDKQYAAPFAMDKRKLYKIGVNFSTATRRISEYEIAEG